MGGINMSEFNFKSQICTSKVQSERLLALGLKKETADMRWERIGRMYDYYASAKRPYVSTDLPAWSLHRLLMMIDSDVQTDGRYISLPHYGFVKKDNIYDNLCDCIEWLIKERHFPKEYLV